MSEKTITVTLTRAEAHSLADVGAAWLVRVPSSPFTKGGVEKLRAALTSSTGPDPENSSGVGEADYRIRRAIEELHWLEAELVKRDQGWIASDQGWIATQISYIAGGLSNLLDYPPATPEPPAPQSEPVVEGEAPACATCRGKRRVLRAGIDGGDPNVKMAARWDDDAYTEPCPDCQPEPSQETNP